MSLLEVTNTDHCCNGISELIFKKVATEIEHILRLSKLKEYASH